MTKLPTYFISHGGGPWPWVPQMRSAMQVLEASLADIPRQLGEMPKAILMISGHWEADTVRIMANPHPSMVYDYSGFPPHTYHVVYGAPGSPELAARVHTLLGAAGIASTLDAQRGFDHGTFAPLEIMYPDASVPVVQLSLKSGYDPEEHLRIGRALAALREEGVLIVGSGLSYHNLRALGPQGTVPSQQFDHWLQETLNAAPAERVARLKDWEHAPSARKAHPQEDHLIPLMVAVGAAEQEPAVMVYHEERALGGIVASSFRFGAAAGH